MKNYISRASRTIQRLGLPFLLASGIIFSFQIGNAQAAFLDDPNTHSNADSLCQNDYDADIYAANLASLVAQDAAVALDIIGLTAEVAGLTAEGVALAAEGAGVVADLAGLGAEVAALAIEGAGEMTCVGGGVGAVVVTCPGSAAGTAAAAIAVGSQIVGTTATEVAIVAQLAATTATGLAVGTQIGATALEAVSYTHLTLPTIYSV